MFARGLETMVRSHISIQYSNFGFRNNFNFKINIQNFSLKSYFSDQLETQSRHIRGTEGTCSPRSNANCRHLGQSANYSPNCCSENEPCGIGEGGCSSDKQCMSNLQCGDNNCGIPGRNDTRCCRTPWNRPGSFIS